MDIAQANGLHRLLVEELSRAGCFQRATPQAARFGAFLLVAYFAAYGLLLAAPRWPLRLLAIVAAALFSVQAGFIAHQAGHGALTHDRRAARWIGQLCHTLASGLSASYFQHIHRLHHPHCNDRGRDPDMQSQFVSMYPQSAAAKRGIGGVISRCQGWLVWLLIGLQGFTLKLDGLRFVRSRRQATRLDQAFLALHALVWLVAPSLVLGPGNALLNYALVTVAIGFYVGSIFMVNHIGTRVIEPGEALSHFEQELTVTRNLGDSRLADFLFGGVNNHIEHHLFPSMPTARRSSGDI